MSKESDMIHEGLRDALIEHATEAIVHGQVPMGLWLGQVVVMATDVWMKVMNSVIDIDEENYQAMEAEMSKEFKQ